MEVKPYRILIKFITRNRPDKFVECINNMYMNITDKINTKIVVTADKDDATMYNKELLQRVKPYIDNYGLEIMFGESKSKVDAINRDLDTLEDWDIVVIMSDDMRWMQGSFDYQIREQFSRFFNDTDGVIDFDDFYFKTDLISMPIVGKKFYDRFGYVANPEYKSSSWNKELTLVSKQLLKNAYFSQQLYKHENPANVGGYVDTQLAYTRSFDAKDNETFIKRQDKNFGLKR